MKYEYSVNIPTKMKFSIFLFESISLQFNAGRQEIRKKKVKMFPSIQVGNIKTLEQNCSQSFSCVLLSPWKKVCLKTSEESKKPQSNWSLLSPMQREYRKIEKSQWKSLQENVGSKLNPLHCTQAYYTQYHLCRQQESGIKLRERARADYVDRRLWL